MTKEEKYKHVQKRVEALLKENGFKKEKLGIRRSFPDSLCNVGFTKFRGYDNAIEICFGVYFTINFHGFNSIFREGANPLVIKGTVPDVSISVEKERGYPWRIVAETDVDLMTAELEFRLQAVLNSLDKHSSLTAFVNRYDYEDLEKLAGLHIRGLVQTAVAAKLCGMTHEYELLLQAISKNPEGNSWFAEYHLGLVANK